jgi:hypothetical protein
LEALTTHEDKKILKWLNEDNAAVDFENSIDVNTHHTPLTDFEMSMVRIKDTTLQIKILYVP